MLPTTVAREMDCLQQLQMTSDEVKANTERGREGGMRALIYQ